jgi:2,3-bisphosphoglycerate-independent phosphoglycerate mutase
MRAARQPSLVLVLLDGWGHAAPSAGNAVARTSAGIIRDLQARYPSTLLSASGGAVGLPDGVMGNSEVGHLTIGAGHVIEQDLTRIQRAVRADAFLDHEPIRRFLEGARARDATVHALGLASDAGVHSHLDHLRSFVRAAARAGAARVRVHAFTDGRDTPPDSGLGYLRALERDLAASHPNACVATVGGRYYAMDRDRRWERVEKAWAALVRGEGERAPGGARAVEQAYAAGLSDEFILPTVISGVERGAIQDGDAVFFFNFRADRARQLTAALTADAFDAFPRPGRPALSAFLGMTVYDEEMGIPAAFTSERPASVLGSVCADLGWRQMRIAETEKYAHVTYFLNGGNERVYPGEERVLVPSPRVATYDLVPEMSAPEVTRQTLEAIASKAFEVVVVNFANADMVGHTGDLAATLVACNVVDEAVGRITEACLGAGGLLVITADHGNAEQMIDPVSGKPHTAHTTNPVPAVFVRPDLRGTALASGAGLSSVLPTAFSILGIGIPPPMDGRVLI